MESSTFTYHRRTSQRVHKVVTGVFSDAPVGAVECKIVVTSSCRVMDRVGKLLAREWFGVGYRSAWIVLAEYGCGVIFANITLSGGCRGVDLWSLHCVQQNVLKVLHSK